MSNNDITQNSVPERQEPGGAMRPAFDLSPKSLDEAMRFADILCKSDIVPKDFQQKPGNVLVAIQWGMELGLKPMQAMQNIAVINGRPSLWGDAVIALVRNSALCEYIYETDDNGTAVCRVKRRGEDEQVRTFSDADAKAANLIGKQGPWASYPKRMKQMRARAFALRDVFPDVLKGIQIAEEVMDIPEREVNPEPDPRHKSEKPPYPEDKFRDFLPKWEKAMYAGKLDLNEIKNKTNQTGPLSPQQLQILEGIEEKINNSQTEEG